MEIMKGREAADQKTVALNSELVGRSLQELETLFKSIVEKALENCCAFDPALANNRLAFSEPEAAALLGVRPHVIRDARTRGEIESTRVGGRIAYTRRDLDAYLESGKVNYK